MGFDPKLQGVIGASWEKPDLMMLKLGKFAAFLSLLAAALTLRYQFDLQHDVLWLLSVAGRVMNGEGLYSEIKEWNPAFSVWIYMPPVALGRIFDISPVMSLYILMFLLSTAVYIATIGLLRDYYLIKSGDEIKFGILFVLIFVALPFSSFAQREHVAIIMLVPWLAIQAVRVGHRETVCIYISYEILAALSGAFIVMVKPYYALTLLAPIIVIAVRNRSFAPFFNLENILAAAIALSYALFFLTAYREYFDTIMPTVLAVYLPAFVTRAVAITVGYVAIYAVVIALIFRDVRWPSMAIVTLAAAIGHLFAVILMGKGFAYHSSPALILCCSAGAALLFSTTSNISSRLSLLEFIFRGSFVLLWPAIVLSMNVHEDLRRQKTDSEIIEYLKSKHFGQTVAQITLDMRRLYIPFKPSIGEKYTSPQTALIVNFWGERIIKKSGMLDYQKKQRIQSEMDLEETQFGEFIIKHSPQIILVSDTASAGASSHWDRIKNMKIGTRRLLDFYEVERRIQNLTIYRKRP